MKATFSLLFTGKKLVFYSFILLMSHCNDTYDNSLAAANLQVPPFTETGANTFGCLVNGQAWANFGGQKYKSELAGYGNVVYNKVTTFSIADSGINVVSIIARLTVSTAGTTTKDQWMTLNIPGDSLNMTGIHQLNQVNGLFTYRDFTKGTVYASLKRNPFTVNVLKDTIASVTGNYPNIIVSGKFNGILYNYDQTDSIRIVGGVFDVKL
jgi:hypothetical protein